MMQPIRVVAVLLGLLLFLVPAASAYTLTITKAPTEAKIGDTIPLTGKVDGINTIAVYLYLTGPGLDSRGVALDNLRIPAGQGLFTTAPVKFADGSWQYNWDTSLIRNTMQPGKYTVNVVAAPIDNLRLRSSGEPFATATILFLPSPETLPTESPSSPFISIAALAMAGLACSSLILKRKT